jgi:hypothetical protein
MLVRLSAATAAICLLTGAAFAQMVIPSRVSLCPRTSAAGLSSMTLNLSSLVFDSALTARFAV